jgi:phage baseplate assembly protein W
MSTEIQLPFHLGPDGTVSTISATLTVTDQHVQSLLSTVQGERVMVPTYGLNLSGLVFGNNDPILTGVIQADVTDAFSQWEPAISITSISQSQQTDAQFGIAAVNVEYELTNSNAVGSASAPLTQTATKTAGGTITND